MHVIKNKDLPSSSPLEATQQSQPSELLPFDQTLPSLVPVHPSTSVKALELEPSDQAAFGHQGESMQPYRS